MKKDEMYKKVLTQVIDLMKTSGSDWTKSWTGTAGLPFSIGTGKAYRGINTLILWCASLEHKYLANQWGTYKAWQTIGAQVRTGEKAQAIVYWKIQEKENKDTGEKDTFPMLRVYQVFNAEQVDGYAVPDPVVKNKIEVIDHAETYFKNTFSDIRHSKEGKAYYVPSMDIIHMPNRDQFTDPESYYATLGHEHVHWTGHKDRCDRKKLDYAFEELVAELGATFLCASLEIEKTPREDHAKYLNSWIKQLSDTDGFKLLHKASTLAQKGVEFMDDLQEPQEELDLKTA
jgi:antirestriction protein ArdC